MSTASGAQPPLDAPVAVRRIVILGGGGQLAAELATLVAAAPPEAGWQALSRAECDITNLHRVRAVIADQARAAGDHGLVVINAGAYTNVDAAEADESAAYAVNAAGPRSAY